MAVVAIVPILSALPTAGLIWLLAGGAAYSVGAVVFVTRRPNLWPRHFESHDLWHTLVLVGSACHFVVMWAFVADA
jgi:hemolysin III